MTFSLYSQLCNLIGFRGFADSHPRILQIHKYQTHLPSKNKMAAGSGAGNETGQIGSFVE